MNKERYLICSDLDGTLLVKHEKISFLTRQIIKRLIKKGNIFVFSTGRTYRLCKDFYEKMNLNSCLITSNGEAILNPKDKSFEPIITYVPKEAICDLYNKYKDKYIEGIYVENGDYSITNKMEAFEFLNQFFDMNNIIVDDINNISKDGQNSFVVLNQDGVDHFKEIQDFLSNKYKDLTITKWGDPHVASIDNAYINKREAIKKLQKYYNIDDDHVIVFGDSMNDIEMLSYYKNSYAMLNGHDEAKKVASFITKKDNEHNGVGLALIEFFKTK